MFALENVAEHPSFKFSPSYMPPPSLLSRVTRHEIPEQDVIGIGWTGLEWSGVAPPDPALNIKWSWLAVSQLQTQQARPEPEYLILLSKTWSQLQLQPSHVVTNHK